MIIVHLIGGLGNQMFQYACGRAISMRNSGVLKLDKSGLGNVSGEGTVREYALGVFAIEESFAEAGEIEKMKNQKVGRFAEIFQKFGVMNAKNTFVVEPHFHFSPSVLNFQGDVYLQGYWQTERYFFDIAEVIRKDFTLKGEFSIEGSEIARKIRADDRAISLHIRRGDYVADANTNAFHGVCSLAYYAEAIRYIAERIDNPVFYIFSDDIAWVRENLKSEHEMVHVSDGVLKDYEELILMSRCRHHIIANSSFSWWGAWLNSNPEKIVIAPKRWFADESIDTRDLIPEGWVRI